MFISTYFLVHNDYVHHKVVAPMHDTSAHLHSSSPSPSLDHLSICKRSAFLKLLIITFSNFISANFMFSFHCIVHTHTYITFKNVTTHTPLEAKGDRITYSFWQNAPFLRLPRAFFIEKKRDTESQARYKVRVILWCWQLYFFKWI